MGTLKILSDYTDAGTVLGTHTRMFTREVLVWVPAPVMLLKKALQDTLDLSRSV
jgi:hypothetical protein